MKKKHFPYTPILVGIVLLVAGGVVYGYQHSTQSQAQSPTLPAPTEPGQVFGSININEFGTLDTQASKKWFLLGEEITPSDQRLTYTLTLTETQRELTRGRTVETTYVVNGTNVKGGLTVKPGQSGVYTAQIDMNQLDPGEYTVQAYIQIGDQKIASLPSQVFVTYPLYVTWTIDWEGYDVKNEYLNDLDELTGKHANFPLTHFFNPRIYTSSMISKERQDYLTNWVLERADKKGHSIGLHLHMFPDMVRAAGVAPKTNPVQWGTTGTDGYDILTMQYSYEELKKMMTWSKQIFAEKGLPTPTMFRAGGWYANEDTLRAAQDTGFLLDSSGRTKYALGTNKPEGPWDLPTTAQPYKPSIENQNATATPTFDIWEFPNNGGDSWAFNEEQMKARFRDNYTSKTLDSKTLVTYLSHPEWFHKDKPRMDSLLTYIDQYLYQSDSGPVKYITLDEAYQIWQ